MDGRTYDMADSDLLEQSKIISDNLSNHLSEFEAYNSNFNADFVASFNVLINEVEGMLDGNVLRDQVARQTEIVKEKMDECFKLFRSMKYFVSQAFKNRSIQNEFGLDKFNKIRNSQAKMIQFMTVLSDTADKYKDDLLAAGCNPHLLDRVKPAAQALDEANREQEKLKGQGRVGTEARTQKLNELYDQASSVVKAAHTIFEDEESKLELFRLNRQASTSKSEDEGAGA